MSGCGCSFTPVENKETEEIKYTDAQIVEVKEYTSDVAESAVLKMTPGQMRAKALEGYFVRDAERNLVYCPQGEILRQKSIKRNGMIRYCNKLAFCFGCLYQGVFVEVCLLELLDGTLALAFFTCKLVAVADHTVSLIDFCLRISPCGQ